jgi:hypothetical protein
MPIADRSRPAAALALLSVIALGGCTSTSPERTVQGAAVGAAAGGTAGLFTGNVLRNATIGAASGAAGGFIASLFD